ILVNRAHTHRARGDTAKAIADLTKAVELNPENVDAYLRRGELYLAHIPERAMLDFSRVIEHQPENAPARIMRALRHEQLGNRDAAINDYRAAYQADPTQIAARDSLKRLGAALPVMKRGSPQPS